MAIYFCDEDIKVNDYLDYNSIKYKKNATTNENKIKKLSLTWAWIWNFSIYIIQVQISNSKTRNNTTSAIAWFAKLLVLQSLT